MLLIGGDEKLFSKIASLYGNFRELGAEGVGGCFFLQWLTLFYDVLCCCYSLLGATSLLIPMEIHRYKNRGEVAHEWGLG